AKLLELSPPNGKTLSIFAERAQNLNNFCFPKPLANQNTLNFSFSGLKTAAMLQIKKLIANQELLDSKHTETKANLAYAFQEAVMDSLVTKCKQALIKTKLNRLVIAGGVSANKSLRNKLLSLEQEPLNNTPIKIFFPKLEFCTDNAAMIAIAGLMRAIHGFKDLNLDLEALPRWNLETV
ncbi:MAG: tRNA (adenosine(37)-N6)-threonylcarbamoyltransferase complex transferase subunit TsaD, partial [Gammaproteobacteria bacterium]